MEISKIKLICSKRVGGGGGGKDKMGGWVGGWVSSEGKEPPTPLGMGMDLGIVILTERVRTYRLILLGLLFI